MSDSAPYGKQWFNYTDAYDNTYVPGTGVWTGSNVPLVTPGETAAGSMPGLAAGGANNVYIPVSFEDGVNPISSAKLQLNGHDRFSERDGRYFNLVQPYQHHENVPSQGINVYSFGLKPEEHQPSGTCNMSRIDNATLQLWLTAATVAGGRTAKVRVFKRCFKRYFEVDSVKIMFKTHMARKSHAQKGKWLVGCIRNLQHNLVAGTPLEPCLLLGVLKTHQGPRLTAVANSKKIGIG